jgi:two-component system sensor histidine kinase CreC
MRLGTRILLGFFVIFAGAFYYLTQGFARDIRYRYLEGVEDVLVDQARILATQVAREMTAGSFSAENLRRVFTTAYASQFTAQIYQLKKTDVDLRVYITDNRGIVIFDSINAARIGDNYADWRDVRLTLQGEYGARSSDADPNDPASTVLYIAAPVKVNGEIAGVLTVCKPTTNINHFLALAKAKLTRKSVLAGLSVLALSTALILWIVRPIKLLTRYADNVRQGKKATLPHLDSSEIGDMGRAFDRMREALEGKKYVEHYIQTLTHELKSPISAIQGAAELLDEEMPRAQRTRFLTNICKETDRVKQLIDRMLSLSSLESKQGVEKPEPLEFNALLDAVIERFHPLIEQKGLELVLDKGDKKYNIMGDAFLIKQAIANLIQNAIDFSPAQCRIAISVKKEADRLVLTIADQGPGIPDFARERLFEKFFSTRRPVSGDKSTGLGLNFVQKIADLHNGAICLENRSPMGAQAILTLPIAVK